MRLLLTLFLLLPFWLNAATAFTEFYCDSGVGTNINSGSTTNAAATYTSVNGNFNGTDTFTPTDGSTPASTVSAGDWAAVYVDGATNLVQASSGGYIVRVLSVAAGANGAITVSTTAFAGTAPSSSATGRSIKVGGAWNGPYGSIGFPFGFLATTATNAAAVFPRCNFKSTSQYNITAAMTHANAGPVIFQGMTLAPNDGGRANIDGGATGTGFILLTLSGVNCELTDLIFSNNGNSGSPNALASVTGAGCFVNRCVFHDALRYGLSLGSGAGLIAHECEAYACGKANGGHAGYEISSGSTILLRCIAHDNAGSLIKGFYCNGAGATLIECIADSNGQHGFYSVTPPTRFIGCDSYNNGGAGIDIALNASTTMLIENCNLIKNTGCGITNTGNSQLRIGGIINCGFGTGTQTNAQGNIAATLSGLSEVGSILYTADQTPWTDPANGDFRLSSNSQAKAAGRGLFTQTAASYSGTVSYPDIGAVQSASTNGAAAATGGSYTWAQ